ncbi:MAG: zinc-dependent metalloprotease [Bacteroidota bacterium]
MRILNSSFRVKILLLCMAALLTFPLDSAAQKKKKNKKETAKVTAPKPPAPPKKKEKKDKTLEEYTKKMMVSEGLFTLYRDSTTGSTYLKVTADQLDQEFIHFAQVQDGILSAGFFRGGYRGARVFSVQKYFNRLEVVMENTRYYFDENNALSKAADANINEPAVLSETIVATSEDKSAYLIKADKLFLAEAFQQIKRPSRPGGPPRFGLGRLSKNKNKYLDIRNYPANTDVHVELVYEDATPRASGGDAATDSRFVSVKMVHSMIEMPDNDFEPRFDDPRVGYFTTQTNDMTTKEAINYRDMIHRWHLVKKDPDAELSEPVEPITWWIENTTPVELRDYIKEGVEGWNKAFEKAGFKNAVVVNIQPDDADWDAGDIRYNVLRWTASPRPPFGGYGPSFVNPRTGQILGADIMLEYTYLTARLAQEKLFDRAALGIDYMFEEGYDPINGVNEFEDQEAHCDHLYCNAGAYLQQGLQFGQFAMVALDRSEEEYGDLIREGIMRLCLHEVGHTLGLNHNFKGSNLRKASETHDKVLTASQGLTGSVMEYPAINFARDKDKQGNYYDINPGPYDLWAIEFAYSPAVDNPTEETERLEQILSRSTEPELMFANDSEDMRSPGKGMDPRAMIYDLSSDPVDYALERIELVNDLLPKIKAAYTQDGESYQELRNAYFRLTGEMGTALRVISRQIGGVYTDHAKAGQEGATQPYTVVDYKTQKRSMDLLNELAFAPDAFEMPDGLYNYLQTQRRGFNFRGGSPNPKALDRYLNIQKDLLNQLLHPNVLKRLIDTELYGNEYHIDEMMNDLTNGIFEADKRTIVSALRQNLQVEYVNRLIGMLGPKSRHTHIAKSNALYQLQQIEEMMEDAKSPDTATKAHRAHVSFAIESALDD